jgi:hypothetical protein
MLPSAFTKSPTLVGSELAVFIVLVVDDDHRMQEALSTGASGQARRKS